MSPPHSAPRLWLVRHAQPLIAPGICYGQHDVAAHPGETQTAARALAAALPPRIGTLRHSTLQRCEQLAHALQGHRPDLASQPDARITELNFGTWEGRPWDTIDRSALDAWSAHLATHAPGGGEPLAAMLQRVAMAWQEAVQPSPAGDVVWITHAGVVRCVQWLRAHGLQRAPTAAEWPREAPAFGQWTVVPLPTGPHQGSANGP